MLLKPSEMHIQFMQMFQKCTKRGSRSHLGKGVHILGKALTAITVLAIRTRNIGVGVVDDAVLLIIYMFCADSEELKGSGKLLGKNSTVIACLILFTMFSVGAVFSFNKEFDTSTPEIIATKVLDHKVSHGKSTSYYLTVSPWIDGKSESKKISVNSKAYKECVVGGTAYIHLYNGALGINWYYVSRK